MIVPGFTTATQNSGAPFPLPIRVSAGFFVTGLLGKIRIHTFPSRFIKRVSATRAASLCRWVIQAGSRAFNPKSPNATEYPRVALPFIRPRWAFLYLTLFGSNIVIYSSNFLLRCSIQDFTTTDPHFHADCPVNRHRSCLSIIDIGTQRVERNAPFFVLF